MNALTLLTLAIVASGQDKPEDINKKDLPKEAECVACSLNGEAHGKEKVAAGVNYKGKAYYFCNAQEAAAFKADPELFIPPVLPRTKPNFGLADSTGKVWDAEAMKGKLVMLDYWATWCKPCKEMFPTFDKLYAKYSAKGFVLLSVSVDEKRSDFDKYLKGHTFPNPVLRDANGVFANWGVRAIPATFLVKGGNVIAQWTGKQTEKTLSTAIEANLP